jgi:hypothetical protein
MFKLILKYFYFALTLPSFNFVQTIHGLYYYVMSPDLDLRWRRGKTTCYK